MSFQKKVSEIKNGNAPTTLLVLGMAGSGKTTLMQRINAHVHENDLPAYVLNLDPAVGSVPYPCNIDIRDTVNYKEVMKQYNLGPNGAIMTSLNLFSTQFDQVLSFIEKKKENLKYVLVDTPGQIEAFTWSASGSIISDSFASSFPTACLYVVDTARCVSPSTFMSNMLYACSILYKTRLPLIVVFNKADVVDHSFALDWMSDFDALQDALQADDSYMTSLTRSMSLMLDEFYRTMHAVGVSAVTGEGITELFAKVAEARKEYFEEYLPETERLRAAQEAREQEEKEKEMTKLVADLNPEKKRGGVEKEEEEEEESISLRPSSLAKMDEDVSDDEELEKEAFEELMEFTRAKAAQS